MHGARVTTVVRRSQRVVDPPAEFAIAVGRHPGAVGHRWSRSALPQSMPRLSVADRWFHEVRITLPASSLECAAEASRQRTRATGSSSLRINGFSSSSTTLTLRLPRADQILDGRQPEASQRGKVYRADRRLRLRARPRSCGSSAGCCARRPRHRRRSTASRCMRLDREATVCAAQAAWACCTSSARCSPTSACSRTWRFRCASTPNCRSRSIRDLVLLKLNAVGLRGVAHLQHGAALGRHGPARGAGTFDRARPAAGDVRRTVRRARPDLARRRSRN